MWTVDYGIIYTSLYLLYVIVVNTNRILIKIYRRLLEMLYSFYCRYYILCMSHSYSIYNRLQENIEQFVHIIIYIRVHTYIYILYHVIKLIMKQKCITGMDVYSSGAALYNVSMRCFCKTYT